MLIDLHAHVIPGELEPVGSGDQPGPHTEHSADDETIRLLVNGRGMRFPASRYFFSSEARLEALEANGVDAEVVSPMPPLLDYTLPAAEGRELSRRVNEFVVQICQAAPDRMLGMGMVPMQDLELATKELAEVKALGLRAVEITSNAAGISIGDERCYEFFAEAERLDLPVLVHATAPTFMDRLPRASGASFAVLIEQAVGATSVIMGGLPERCPNLRLCFTHGGGGIAAMVARAHYFWGGTWDEAPAERPTEGPSPAEVARRYFYDAHPIDHRVFRLMIDTLGAGQLVVGTDFPAMPREEPCGRTLYGMGLPAEELEQITWTNAFRFLGIEPPAR
jgi:aminocarboxymuconate-semialdehyde decarboxylase